MKQEPDETLLGKPVFYRYWLATRPAFLVASLIPVLVGAGAAHYQGYPSHAWLLLLSLLAMALLHAGVNVLNDYYDELNGTDRSNTERIFPFTGGSRMIQNGVISAPDMKCFGVFLLMAAVLLGVWLAELSGQKLLMVGVAGVLLGWGYSAPPLRLNARGLGEPSVALGFGILAPLGAWFVQTGSFAWYPVLVSLPLSLLVMNILYINQFPDYTADKLSGKHHWVVRLGLGDAPWVYISAVVLAILILWLEILAGLLPPIAMLSFIPLVVGYKAGLDLLVHADNPPRLELPIKKTISVMVSHGLLLALILWLV